LFRDGQGDTVATLTAKTVPLASNPFPWWEKLPMDVSLSVRFTAAERWKKGAARRVLIDSDLWSEPSLAEAASDSYVGTMGNLFVYLRVAQPAVVQTGMPWQTDRCRSCFAIWVLRRFSMTQKRCIEWRRSLWIEPA
jgi:hypothetical protein